MGTSFEPDLLFTLHAVSRLMRMEGDRRARAHGSSKAQWSILFALKRRPGLSQKELADWLEIEPISVARLVDRLEGQNLVERRADEQDRRIWRLHLTEDAEPMLAELAVQRDEMTRLVTAGLTPALQEAMIEGLRIMKANLLREHPSCLLAGLPLKTEETA